MNIDTDKLLLQAINDSIAGAVKANIEGYNSPLNGIIKNCIMRNESSIHTLINEAISTCVTDEAFRSEIKKATRTQLAKVLVQRIGGEIEKQVNTLKSDPTTRARITMAINAIVTETPK